MKIHFFLCSCCLLGRFLLEPTAPGLERLRILDHSMRVCVYVKMSNRFCASTSAGLCGCRLGSSLHSEAAGLLYSRQQFLVEFLVRLVGRDVDSVETGNREESVEQIGRFEAFK